MAYSMFEMIYMLPLFCHFLVTTITRQINACSVIVSIYQAVV